VNHALNAFDTGRREAYGKAMTFDSRKAGGLLAALCLALAVQRSGASSVIAQHDWDTVAHDWDSLYGNAQLNRQVSGPNGWLRITFPASEDPLASYDIVYTKAENLFAGSWSENIGVQFDFWAEDGGPDQLELRWRSSLTNEMWAAPLSPGPGGASKNYLASLFYTEDWKYTGVGGGSGELYRDQLASIDWIGIYVKRFGTGQEQYGLDNVRLMVPEPSQWLMLGTAMAVSAWTLRRRVSQRRKS
jgi:hypothetical protein